MAKSEGARRIMMVGMAIVLIGVTLGVLAGFLLSGSEILVVGMFVLYIAGLGGLVWVAGWIVQGFFIDPPRRG